MDVPDSSTPRRPSVIERTEVQGQRVPGYRTSVMQDSEPMWDKIMNPELRLQTMHAALDELPSFKDRHHVTDYDMPLVVNCAWLQADEVVVEPPSDYHNPRRTHLCYHSVTAMSPASRLEGEVMAQFDRGAIPSMISQRFAEELRIPLKDRPPTPVQGLGGVITMTKECIVFLRIDGFLIRPGNKKDEGVYAIRCLVAKESPVPLLVGCVSMDLCGFHIDNDGKSTTFGDQETRVHMVKLWEDWQDVRRKWGRPHDIRPLRQTV